MPNYFHHLKFELYPYPERSSDHIYGKKSHIPAITASTRNADSAARELWLPEQGVDIFDSARWPRHRPVNESAAKGPAGLEKAETAQPAHGRGSRGGHSISRGGGFELEPRRSDYDTVNHDARGTLPQRGDTGQQVSNAKANSSDFEIARRDWRFGRVRVESWETTLNFTTGTEEGNMNRPGLAHRRGESSAALTTIGGEEIQRSGINAGLAAGGVGKVTKSRFEEGKNTEVGWGIVHLYRDGEESVSHGGHKEIEVYGSGLGSRGSEDGRLADEAVGEGERRDEEDYTTLCIPAVPSYLTPSDFLGFVGEKTREEVSHFRMVMTGRMNRYLVLMKFRDGAVAKRWKAEWDGKVFNSMEPETCHVTFIKSITFQSPSSSSTTATANASFPALAYDPFTPSSTHLKPFPPPTPSLIELPTCPVCLERMDDTTGLLTILCQHVFHCSCLQKWRGSGCPVCRHTNTSTITSPSLYPTEPPFGSSEASLCSVCDTSDDLWICLICGNVGCGRYKGGHAKEHWKDTSHCFALEIETQHVWDYAGDVWVHRLIRDKGNGKVVELPSTSRGEGGGGGGEVDMVPREKLERIGMEYTHLLTSQLESQRVYFEELVSKAVAEASQASSSAQQATLLAEEALSKLRLIELENQTLKTETLPNLEKDLARERRKAEKSAELARGFGKSLMEEKRVSEGLLERIDHVNKGMVGLGEEMGRVRGENEELKEMNRDLLFSVTAGEKLREMNEGTGGELGLEEGEVAGGSLVVGEKKKGKGRKR